MQWYKILLIVLGSLIGIYIFFLLLVALEYPQRHILYLNGVKFPYWRNLWKPETLGFSGERVHPFVLETPDKERIFAWHILPLDKNISGFKENEHLHVLQNDKTARVIIYFHGTASHIGQTMRLDTYRLLTASNPNTHLLAVDYRGWGYSSGIPSEAGVITDGLTILDWAMKIANVDPSQILIVAQSLGTGIAMGVVSQYHSEHPDRPLAGLVMIASFTNLRNLVGAYRMGGFLPLLGPLKIIPKARDYFIDKCLRASFDTAQRMRELVRTTRGTKFSVTLLHALNDWEISYLHSRELFVIACDGDSMVSETINTDKVTKEVDNGRIKHIETIWGGHNKIQKSDAVVKAVMSAWR